MPTHHATTPPTGRRLTRFHALLLGATSLALVVVLLTSGSTCVALLALIVVATSLVAAGGVARPQWQFFGPVLCSVPVVKPLVALTFDDGPDPQATPALLDLLVRRKIPATFFCIGQRVAQHPDLCGQAARAGHQIENHAWEHSRWTNFFSVQRLEESLAKTQSAIAEVTGRAPTCFRPPMGLTNFRVLRAVDPFRLRVVGWSAGGRDQNEPDPHRIVDRILRRLRPGAIILLHDGGVPADRLVTTVDLLVDKLQAAAYECVRLDALVAAHANAAPSVSGACADMKR